MNAPKTPTASHALLEAFAASGVDRAFLVPGESYLGILDALNEVTALQVVTCRHEAGAGFMACADARLTGRPALVLVSRGPGASNASIALHTAQQDAVPLVLVVGQVPKDHVGREAFQEIDYRRMFGGIAKWVAEVREPQQMAETAFKAVRMATSGTPGPVVVVVPEDIQQPPVAAYANARARPHEPAQPTAAVLRELAGMLQSAERPMVVAGSGFENERGRAALLAFAQAWQLPVAVSFRRHDIFPNAHALYAGDLGLSNAREQMDAFHASDLILALGTRMGDITSQGYTFPRMPAPAQAVVHCHADAHQVGLNFAPRMGIVCDPVALAQALAEMPAPPARAATQAWRERLSGIQSGIAAWPAASEGPDVVRSLARQRKGQTIVCLDAGTFAAPVYRHFCFQPGERLLSPIAGAMGYGTPAAVAAQMRCPEARVVCLAGDGGFLMTGNEMMAAVERQLPILFIVVDNCAYGSIWLHQNREYPGRHVGTTVPSPDFGRIAAAFGMPSETVSRADEIDAAVARGLAARTPYFLHVKTTLPPSRAARPAERDE